MSIRRTVLIFAACALLVAGCGDDDTTTTGDTTAETPEQPEETSAPEDEPDDEEPDDDSEDDQAIADGALLTLSDFPSGWTEKTDDDDRDEAKEEEQERAIAECLGVDYERLYGDDISAESPTFVSPDDEEVSNTAGLEDTEEDAIFVMETLASDDAARCFAEVFQKLIEDEEMGEGVEVGAVSFDRLSLRDDLGDESNGFRVTIPIAADGMEVDAYLDVAVARVGRGGITVQTFSMFTPFDTAELERYTELAADRLRDGLDDAG